MDAETDAALIADVLQKRLLIGARLLARLFHLDRQKVAERLLNAVGQTNRLRQNAEDVRHAAQAVEAAMDLLHRIEDAGVVRAPRLDAMQRQPIQASPHDVRFFCVPAHASSSRTVHRYGEGRT